MDEGRNTVGLAPDFIIHPGETLSEVIVDRGMSQRELATRTGVSEKHVSTVIHGQKNISAAFARKLEYALGIEAAFWMNLQANYDRELLEFEEVTTVSEEELSVTDKFKEVIDLWVLLKWVGREEDPVSTLMQFRRLLGISNLLDIPKLPYVWNYCSQHRSTPVEPYALFAWRRTCELIVQGKVLSDTVSLDRLQERMPEIKLLILTEPEQIREKLSGIIAECMEA